MWWSVILFVCCVEKNDVLVQAVRRGDIQAVTHVLKMGVDIDTRYEYGSGCVVSYNVCTVFFVI